MYTHAVQLNLTSEVPEYSSIELSLNTSCFSSALFNVDKVTNLYLEALETSCTENCTLTNKSFIIDCNHTSTTVTIDGLKETTSYNLSVIWVSPFNSSAVCMFSQTTIRTSMKNHADFCYDALNIFF